MTRMASLTEQHQCPHSGRVDSRVGQEETGVLDGKAVLNTDITSDTWNQLVR